MSQQRSLNFSAPGCFGCLLTVVGILGLIYIFFHWAQIWALVTGS